MMSTEIPGNNSPLASLLPVTSPGFHSRKISLKTLRAPCEAPTSNPQAFLTSCSSSAGVLTDIYRGKKVRLSRTEAQTHLKNKEEGLKTQDQKDEDRN